MKNLLRPYWLLVLSAGLGIAAVVLGLRSPAADGRPRVGPVPAGCREICWMYPATNSAAWERFVTAAGTAVARIRASRPDLDALNLEVDASGAFPSDTTSVPEFAVRTAAGEQLLFRWCKLTSSSKADQWIDALTHNRPAPLAVIGGSSSESAMELARALNRDAKDGREEVTLVLTYATSGELTNACPARTFRFCFTNEQMARAVTEFARSREKLRPDPERVFFAYWKDDPYSIDLTGRLCEELQREADARATVRAWAWQAGFSAVGGFPLDLGGLCRYEEACYPEGERIPSGVGGFNQPNRWEAESAARLIDRLGATEGGRVPLVLPAGSAQAARRFLRSLVRAAPTQARRFVVLTGDVISFNTVYRDRSAAWPIQDVPFDLVFFCHRNPISDGDGFTPETPLTTGRDGAALNTTGTDELLLAVDIVEALVQASLPDGSLVGTADELRERLKTARWEPNGRDGRVGFGGEGVQFFRTNGDRRYGTGEHVVWLAPRVEGQRLLPRAGIEVWAWQGASRLDRSWKRALGSPLEVEYDRYDREP